MQDRLFDRRTLDFLLFDALDAAELFNWPRFADHDREGAAAMLDSAAVIAAECFAPHNRKADDNEPRMIDGKAAVIPEVKAALDRYIEAGFLSATADYDQGGLQLPFLLHTAAGMMFAAANVGTKSYVGLTAAAANLLSARGDDDLKRRYLPNLRQGRSFGAMALTEPQAGSSVGDLKTRAVPVGDGSYRLFGQKIFISAGDHELSENIAIMTLARLPDAPAGVKGISLFLVPKYLADDDGAPGRRNDVALAGLIHKMGWRGTTSTLLNFGENDGAVGWMIGKPNQGLAAMFHMMNEARIGVGAGAAALGWAGYRESLAYAKERRQGRPLDERDPVSPPVPIINHSDVRRMLLAQKAYVEAAVGLCLYAARLVDVRDAHPDATARADAGLLLDVLTPVAKSWPSQWGVEANSLAVQIHGGYGYTRDYPVEQYFRDNRLNPIHEGTHGIQALDLLGRKVVMSDGRGFQLLCAAIRGSAANPPSELAELATRLLDAVLRMEQTTQTLVAARMTAGLNVALGNASAYLDAVGHVAAAWRLYVHAATASRVGCDPAFVQGEIAACRWFFAWELPKVDNWFAKLATLERTALDAPEDGF